MKRIRNSLFFGLLLLISFSCDPSSHEAKKYLTQLNQVIDGVVETEDSLIVLINKKMLEGGEKSSVIEEKENNENTELNVKIEKVYQLMLDSIRFAKEQITSIEKFDGKDNLMISLTEVLDEYERLSQDEYKEVVRISLIPSVLYTEEDDNEFMQISAYIDSCIGAKLDSFNLKQKEFLMRYQAN